MKKLMILTLALVTSVGASAQNLIQNGDFSKEVTTVLANANKSQAGDWFIVNNDAEGVAQIKCTDGTIVMTSEKKPSWYKTLLGQRIQSDKIEPGIYTLSFDFKADSKDAKVAVYIRQTNDNIDENTGKAVQAFFVRDGFNMDSAPTNSGSIASKNAGKNADKWTNTSFDFDFGQTINNANSKSSMGDALKVSTADNNAPILSDFYIVIQPGGSAAQSIEIDNVKLVKKQ